MGWTVVAALLPAAAAGAFHFGLPAVTVMVSATGGCLVLQLLLARAAPRAGSPTAGRAALVGLLLGMNLPPSSPLWLILAGCVMAMVCAAGVRRALGFDPHPAVAALVFLAAVFPEAATSWTQPVGLFGSASIPASTSPLVAVTGDPAGALVGRVPGGSGATAVVALALGGFFLLIRGVVRWQTPVGVLVGLVAPAAIRVGLGAGHFPGAAALVLSGEVALGALFVATDPTASPRSGRGRLLHAAGCGLLTWLIGTAGNRSGGVWIALLLMNMCVPIIDLYTGAGGGPAEQPAAGPLGSGGEGG